MYCNATALINVIKRKSLYITNVFLFISVLKKRKQAKMNPHLKMMARSQNQNHQARSVLDRSLMPQSKLMKNTL